MARVPRYLLARLRDILDMSHNGVISFSEFVRGLDALTGAEGVRLALVFRLFVSYDALHIARADAAAAVEVALTVLNSVEESEDGFELVGDDGEEERLSVRPDDQEAVSTAWQEIAGEKDGLDNDEFAQLVAQAQRLIIDNQLTRHDPC